MWRRFLLLAALVVGGAPPARALATPATPTREALSAVEAQFDLAVDRVSLPRVAGLLVRDTARGYRLPGYGMVFVLTPRALPEEGRDVLVRLAPRRRAARTQPAQGSSPAPGSDDDDPRQIETLERHVIVLQSETERARRAAEQDMERIVRELRVRVAGPQERLEMAPEDETLPATGEAPLPPPPPWKYWFEAGHTRDERSPGAIVADVRQALLGALESQAARLAELRGEEYVAIAVDFEAPDPFAVKTRPERTLVVRARVADIAARARGAIDSEEFRRRVEAIEY